jgi:hypothetical protein
LYSDKADAFIEIEIEDYLRSFIEMKIITELIEE